jgi:hypothetical protein
MTAVPTADVHRSNVRLRRAVPLGALAGLSVAVIARFWMRWISTDPEFSWPGTIGILTGFTLFGGIQAGAAAYRRRERSRRRTTLVRVVSGALSMGIFGAAGAVMFPTVLFGGLAAWRRDWWPAARTVSAIAAAPLAIFTAGDIVDDFGWSIATVGRLAVFVAIYAGVIAATRPTIAPIPDGWRLPRAVAWTLFATIVALVGAGVVFHDQLFV